MTARRSAAVFPLLLVTAFLLSYVPLLSTPFSWLMTYFHEISHGIGTVLTGGSIVRIELNLDGSGVCTTRGGWRFVILNAGYVGAIAFGALIYSMADDLNHRATSMLAVVLGIAIALTGVLYGRDPVTWIVILVIAALVLGITRLQDYGFSKLGLKFVGLYVLLDAVRAPLDTLGGSTESDAAKLAQMTFLPVIVWACVWMALGLLTVVWLWRRDLRRA